MAAKERPQTPLSISATSSSSEEESPVRFNDFCHITSETVNDETKKIYSQKMPKIDPTVLTDLEEQAKLAAGSLAWMTKHLMDKLAEMSAVTVQSSNIYAEAVQKASCNADENIRQMYVLMAKCEELNQKMKPVYELQSQVEDIKQKLDILEFLFK